MRTTFLENKKYGDKKDNNKKNNVLSLPVEILYDIMSILNIRDIRCLSMTSRLLWNISRKYHFGIVSPCWEPAEIPKIDALPIECYRDGVWSNNIYYLPVFSKESSICWTLNLFIEPIKWTSYPIKIENKSQPYFLPIKHYAAVTIKNSIYILGGLTDKGTTTNILYLLNSQTFVLRVLKENDEKAFPSPRMLHTLDVIDKNHLAMFGGRLIHHNNLFDSKDFAIYNIRTNDWSYPDQEPNVPYRRSMHGSCIMNEKLYIYGGQQYKYFPSDVSQIHDDEDISVYDFRKKKWYKLLNPSTKASFPLPNDWTLTTSVNKKHVPGKKMCAAMLSMGNRIAIFGGSSKEENNESEINQPWQLMHLLSTVKHKHSWEYIRIKNLPRMEILSFYWKGWNSHNDGLFLIGTDKKEGNLISGWIKDSTNIL